MLKTGKRFKYWLNYLHIGIKYLNLADVIAEFNAMVSLTLELRLKNSNCISVAFCSFRWSSRCLKVVASIFPIVIQWWRQCCATVSEETVWQLWLPRVPLKDLISRYKRSLILLVVFVCSALQTDPLVCNCDICSRPKRQLVDNLACCGFDLQSRVVQPEIKRYAKKHAV